MTCSPSMWLMKSPGCIPARDAGVSSMGEMTLTRPFSIVTSMPSPPNSPRGLHLHVLELARWQVAGMGVERREHPLDRSLDELFVGHVLHIFRAHALEDIAEQVELAVRSPNSRPPDRRRREPAPAARAPRRSRGVCGSSTHLPIVRCEPGNGVYGFAAVTDLDTQNAPLAVACHRPPPVLRRRLAGRPRRRSARDPPSRYGIRRRVR